MMAFFFTMPMSRKMPMNAIRLNSMPTGGQRQQRADAGRRQRGEDGERVEEAFVENAEHEVDDEQAARMSKGWF